MAAKYLAPEQVWNVAVIGTGDQARYQLDALAHRPAGVHARERVGPAPGSRGRARRGACRTGPGLPEGCAYEVARSVDDAVHDADVVITCTGSQSALVRGEWLKLGAHVTAVGSDAPDKQELDPSLPARADLLVVDSRRQASEIGELHHALAAGLIDERKAVELGEICARTHPGRTSASQLTVCDLTGVGVQDVAAANVVMANVGDRGEIVTL